MKLVQAFVFVFFTTYCTVAIHQNGPDSGDGNYVCERQGCWFSDPYKLGEDYMLHEDYNSNCSVCQAGCDMDKECAAVECGGADQICASWKVGRCVNEQSPNFLRFTNETMMEKYGYTCYKTHVTTPSPGSSSSSISTYTTSNDKQSTSTIEPSTFKAYPSTINDCKDLQFWCPFISSYECSHEWVRSQCPKTCQNCQGNITSTTSTFSTDTTTVSTTMTPTITSESLDSSTSRNTDASPSFATEESTVITSTDNTACSSDASSIPTTELTDSTSVADITGVTDVTVTEESTTKLSNSSTDAKEYTSEASTTMKSTVSTTTSSFLSTDNATYSTREASTTAETNESTETPSISSTENTESSSKILSTRAIPVSTTTETYSTSNDANTGNEIKKTTENVIYTTSDIESSSTNMEDNSTESMISTEASKSTKPPRSSTEDVTNPKTLASDTTFASSTENSMGTTNATEAPKLTTETTTPTSFWPTNSTLDSEKSPSTTRFTTLSTFTSSAVTSEGTTNPPKEAECPDKYYFHYGGTVNPEHVILVNGEWEVKVPSIQKCGHLCDKALECKAIQWSSINRTCVLVKIGNAMEPKYNDYRFCSKVERHEQCCIDNGVSKDCLKFCIPIPQDSSMERSYLPLIRKCRAYYDVIDKCTHNDCPNKYIKKHGFTPFVEGEEGIEATQMECAKQCSENPECRSFEHSSIEGKCNFNLEWEPTKGPHKDYVFCSKELDPGVECCTDEGVPIECMEFCVPHPGNQTFPMYDNVEVPNLRHCRRYFRTVINCTEDLPGKDRLNILGGHTGAF